MARPSGRWLPILPAVVGWSVAVGGAALGTMLRLVDPVPVVPNAFDIGTPGLAAVGLLASTWATVGAVLMIRRPGQVVGRWVLLVGAGHGLAVFAAAAASSVVARGDASFDAARWLGWLAGLATLLGSGIFYLAMIFPTGRGHTRGWDRAANAVLAFIVLTITSLVTRPGPLHLMPSLQSPLGIGPDVGLPSDQAAALMTIVGTALFAPPVVASMVSRYRAAGPVVRAQLRWFASSIVLTLGALAVAGVTAVVRRGSGDAPLIAFGLVGSTVPMAIGIAILRYRLYEIDRIVSRTIAWTATTGLVLVLFGTLVLATSTLLGTAGGGSTFAVAASTVVAAAAFQAARGRIQGAVDRRFNRAHVDASATLTALAASLRDEVDLAAIEGLVLSSIRTTVAPRDADVWLRGGASLRAHAAAGH